MYKLVASMLIAAMLSSTAVAADEINWIEVNGNDLDQLIKDHATKNWKPVFLLFTAPEWCGLCRMYESGALADSSVIEEINNSFTPLVVYGNDRNDPDYQKYLRQYGVRGVPTTILMDPMGKEIEGTRMEGPSPSQNVLNNLEKVKNGIRWTDTVERAIKIGKELLKPVIEIRTTSDDYSQDLLFVMKKLPSLTKISSRFVWVESDAEMKNTSSKGNSGIYFIDPYTGNDTAVKVSDILLIKSELLKHLDKFTGKYVADGQYLCESCGTVSSKEECDDCGAHNAKIHTFKCENCGKASATQKNCCGAQMEPVIREK